MKTIFTLILCLVGAVTASAQELSYGLTARAGAFKTLMSHERTTETDYGIGLQFAIGGWAKLPVSSQGSIQLNLLQTAERQYAGQVQVIDENRQPIADAIVRDHNSAVALQVLYLYTLTEKWGVGVGLGSRYEYYSENRIEKKYEGYLIRPGYSDNYRQDMTLHLPIESQYKINDRFSLVAQAQFQLTNRLKDAGSGYWERDLGGTVGVNYSIK